MKLLRFLMEKTETTSSPTPLRGLPDQEPSAVHFTSPVTLYYTTSSLLITTEARSKKHTTADLFRSSSTVHSIKILREPHGVFDFSFLILVLATTIRRPLNGLGDGATREFLLSWEMMEEMIQGT